MARRAALADVVEELPQSDCVEGAPHPRHTTQIFGHQAVEQGLLEAWNAGKMPHALLLSGPKGIGKASFAYRLARFVLSVGAGDAADALFGADDAPLSSFDVDVHSPAVERVTALSHGDLKLLRRQWDRDRKRFKANIAVDDIRALTPFFGATAAEGGWRVAIVDAAEDMNRAAANALLKTLEEPPAKTLLILVSHNAGRLLPTIRSRCRKVIMTALDATDFAAALAATGQSVSEGERVLLARLAAGRPGRALEILGEDGLTLFQDLVGFAATPDAAARQRFAAALSAQKADARFRLLEDILADWLAQMARATATGTSPYALLPAEEALINRGVHPTAFGDVAEQAKTLFSETIGLNLDKRQMLLRLFDTLDASWQGR